MSQALIVGESFLAPLHRHFINLMCTVRRKDVSSRQLGNPEIFNFSAFVVEIANRWFAITAAHIFSDLKIIQSQGAEISAWQIDDSILIQNPLSTYPITLDIVEDVFLLGDNALPGMDYAAFEIGYLTQQALSKSGISPIKEEYWKKTDDIPEYHYWILVGTPSQLSTLKIKEPSVKNHVTVHVEYIQERPPQLEDKEYERIFAKIDFDSVLGSERTFDIAGMSGGPIFGLKPPIQETGIADYRIIGIQSAWNSRSQHIAMCAAQPFFSGLAAAIAEKEV